MKTYFRYLAATAMLLTLSGTTAFAKGKPTMTTLCPSNLRILNQVVGYVPGNVTLTVLTTQDRWNWVEYRGVKGWLDALQAHCPKPQPQVVSQSTSRRSDKDDCEPGDSYSYMESEEDAIGESGPYRMYARCIFSPEDNHYVWSISNLSNDAGNFHSSE